MIITSKLNRDLVFVSRVEFVDPANRAVKFADVLPDWVRDDDEFAWEDCDGGERVDK